MKIYQYPLPVLLPSSWDPPACWDTPERDDNAIGAERIEAIGDNGSESRQAGNIAPDGSLADLSR